MSRQSVVTEPALPATCLVCRRSANGAVKFLDFNTDFDFYGAVVICEDCMTESYELLGFVKVEKLEVALEEIQTLLAKNEQLNADVYTYRGIIDSIGLVRPDLELPSLKSQESVRAISELNKSTESDEHKSDESDSSGGLANVSDNGDGDSNLFG